MAETIYDLLKTTKAFPDEVRRVLDCVKDMYGKTLFLPDSLSSISKKIDKLSDNSNGSDEVAKAINEGLNNLLGGIKTIGDALTDIASFYKSQGKKSEEPVMPLETPAAATAAAVPESNAAIVDAGTTVPSSAMAEAFKPVVTESPMAKSTERIATQLDILVNHEKEAARNNKALDLQNKLPNGNNNKTQVLKPGKTQKGKSKKDKTFNEANFLKTLGSSIFKGIKAALNPVAIVAAFFSKWLPYILIFGALLYGMFKGASKETQAKINKAFKWAKRIALGVFALWKGLPLLFKVLQFAYHSLRLVFLFREHKQAMAINEIVIVNETVEHNASMLQIIFEKGLALIRHVASLLTSLFKRALAFMEFIIDKGVKLVEALLNFIAFLLEQAVTILKATLAVAGFGLAVVAILFIIGLMLLMVFGVVMLFVFMKKAIGDAVDEIVTAFEGLKEVIGDIFHSIMDPLCEVLCGLIDIFTRMILATIIHGTPAQRGEAASSDNSNVSSAARQSGDTISAIASTICEPLKIVLQDLSKIIANQATMINAMAIPSITASNNSNSTSEIVNTSITPSDSAANKILKQTPVKEKQEHLGEIINKIYKILQDRLPTSNNGVESWYERQKRERN